MVNKNGVRLSSRRLEVAGEIENGRARGRHACLLLAGLFFLVPTTSKRLLRRLKWSVHRLALTFTNKNLHIVWDEVSTSRQQIYRLCS